MKRLFLIILSLILCLNLTGCSSNTEQNERKPVTINLPTDNTVNGYRTVSSAIGFESDTIDADKVTAQSKTDAVSSADTQTHKEIQYCANLNSKVFHLCSCKSVKNMKENNKFFSKDRNLLIETGYTPCSNCKP